MSDKPTCKVVKGKINGKNVGARMKGVVNGKLAPPGVKCKVRNVVRDDNTVVSKDKNELPKVKAKELDNKHKALVSHMGKTKEFTYDTGAMITLMDWSAAREMKIAKKMGSAIQSPYTFTASSARTASGQSVPTTKFENVPLKLDATGETGRGTVMVMNRGSMLLGITHIKHYKRYKLKFR